LLQRSHEGVYLSSTEKTSVIEYEHD